MRDVPEYKTWPTLVPTNKIAPAWPHPGTNPAYTWWLLAALYGLQSAGIGSTIAAAIANLEAVTAQAVTDDSSYHQRFSFAIVG